MQRFLKILPSLLSIFPVFIFAQGGLKHTEEDTVLKVKHTTDFQLTGDGSAANWKQAEWLDLPNRTNPSTGYESKVKVLYSDTGIYCLYYFTDKQITATLKEDYADLYDEDVAEAFFWTDETTPIYFEYELSPYNYELPILVPNIKGHAFGWRPWHYEKGRRTRHATHIEKNGNTVTSWTVEFFIPYALLSPMKNVPPVKGSRWRANFYRIDYDKGEATWQWQTVRDINFHDYNRFGIIEFD